MSVLERIFRIVAHLTVALSATFVLLVVLDYYNPLMSFLTNRISIMLLLAFCACSAITAAGRLVLTSPALRRAEDEDGTGWAEGHRGRHAASGGRVRSRRPMH